MPEVSLTAMAKNYSHCPLKKRPVPILYDISDEPENLSTKPEDLRRTERRASVSPPASSAVSTASFGGSSPTSPQSTLSPSSSPPASPPFFIYQPTPIKSEVPMRAFTALIKSEPQLPAYGAAVKPERRPVYPAAISPEYAPQTWHRSVAPLYPPAYPFAPYHPYHGEYLAPRSPHSDHSSLSPPHHMQQPLAPLAVRPTVYSSIDQSSLSPSSSTTSPPPPAVVAAALPEDLSERQRRQGVRHQCADCGKSYSTFSGLSKHRQFHCAAGDGPKKSFSCKYCSKVYFSLGALKMHIRTHTLPCKCTICGKAFSRPWLLQGHVRTHTGEKPFSCTYCNRAFADRSNLRAHLQTHSDVKKYSCPTCSKTFSRMSLLTKHAEGGCGGGVGVGVGVGGPAPTLLHQEKISYV